MITETLVNGRRVQTSSARGFAGFAVEQLPDGFWVATRPHYEAGLPRPHYEAGLPRRNFCDPQQNAKDAWSFVEEYVYDCDYGCP